MVWFYLFVAVLAQSGQAHVTYGVPNISMSECQSLRADALRRLAAEAKVQAPENAAKFAAFCVPVDFSDAASLPGLPKHVPALDEA